MSVVFQGCLTDYPQLAAHRYKQYARLCGDPEDLPAKQTVSSAGRRLGEGELEEMSEEV